MFSSGAGDLSGVIQAGSTNPAYWVDGSGNGATVVGFGPGRCRRLMGRIQAVELIPDGNTKVQAALALPQHRQNHSGQLRVLPVL